MGNGLEEIRGQSGSMCTEGKRILDPFSIYVDWVVRLGTVDLFTSAMEGTILSHSDLN